MRCTSLCNPSGTHFITDFSVACFNWLVTSTRQKLQRVDWSAIFPDFEMQAGLTATPVIHLCNHLPFAHFITFFYEYPAQITVSAKQTVRVFYDNKPTIATKSTPFVNNSSAGGCFNALSGPSSDLNAFSTRHRRIIGFEQ